MSSTYNGIKPYYDLRSNENYEIVNIVIEQNIIYNREKIDTEIFHNENKYYMNIFYSYFL